MALQLGALRDALLDAGASEAKAALAAEELAGYENRFDGVERRLDQVEQRLDRVDQRLDQVEHKVDGLRSEMNERFTSLRGDIDVRFAEVTGRLTRMEWMMGTLIVLVLGVLGRLLFIH
jgi:tetrahydromethanopterin S-methyltransferase subunit G